MARKASKHHEKRAKRSVTRQSDALRLAGVELYFDDLERARNFYHERLGLSFICLERKGAENYPSADKSVLFFEVADLNRAIARIGPHRILHHEPNAGGRQPWAVLHDPEGHNILLLERKSVRWGR